jgi:glycosyltransferase involved in cell wall biosynthesis
MPTEAMPLVSVVTPVYNEAKTLEECIESVRAQTYTNWDYTIVNNCSTDESLAIAQKYALADPRIRVVSTDRLLPHLENHNLAIRQISPQSKYCKFVFGDDWLYPTCIDEMVRTAEEHRSVGLVSSYITDGRHLLLTGLAGRLYEIGPPYARQCVPGRDVCRTTLLGKTYVFGSMTSVLIRSDLIRKRPLFFNERHLHADTEAFFDILQESDFGFVHQVLSYTRQREESQGSFARDFDSVVLGNFVIFLKYGPVYLEEAEYRRQLNEMARMYHRALARNVLRFRSQEFWKYHQETLTAFGGAIDRGLLRRSVVSELAGYLRRPGYAASSAKRWWLQAMSRMAHARS